MKTRLNNYWESLRTSFWLIPALMVVAAIVLAATIGTFSQQPLLLGFEDATFFYNGSTDGVRAIFTTIAGAVITVAGVAFSITIVTLTLASSQFGPMLLRNFIQDAGNQFVLGVFIATFIYCIFSLRFIEQQFDNEAMTHALFVIVAMLLALFNVATLIYFIHHVSTSIQAENVIAKVSDRLADHIVNLPWRTDSAAAELTSAAEPGSDYPHRIQLTAEKSGYIQAIDYRSLVGLADSHDCLLKVNRRAGKPVEKDGLLMTVYSSKPLSASVRSELLNQVIVGDVSTPEQDIEYSIRQLVEIAVRALSPGINDPFTASNCIDHLTFSLCDLSRHQLPPSLKFDSTGTLRVIADVTTFDGATNAAFDLIRQYGQQSVAVTIRLMESMTVLAGHCQSSSQKDAIEKQATILFESSRAQGFSEADQVDIKNRYDGFCRKMALDPFSD